MNYLKKFLANVITCALSFVVVVGGGGGGGGAVCFFN